MEIVYINAHGADHGLEIVVDLDRHEVLVRQWNELCEANEHGSFLPHIQTARIPLRRLLDPSEQHSRYVTKSARYRRQIDCVVSLAINWLCYWGGDEEMLDDNDRPCDHFGSWWGKKNAVTRPAHLQCPSCGALPSEKP